MKKLIISIFLFVLLPCLYGQTSSNIRVTAIGMAPPGISQKTKARALAFRAAKLECYKKLAIAAGCTNSMEIWTKKYTRFNVFLSGATVISQKYISDHKVEISMEMAKDRLIEQINLARRKLFLEQIAEVNRRIKFVESQIFRLSKNLEGLKLQLKQLEEEKHESI